MKKLIATVILGLAILFVAFAIQVASTTAHAAEWKWQHFGAAPYASSREEAMKTRENAFLKLGFPIEAVDLLVEETKKPGEKTSLKVGDRFSAQVSKGGAVHGLKEGGGIVAFESTVRGMQYVATAEKWQVTWEGKVYTIILPEVCFNWTSIVAIASVPTPAAMTSTCPNGWTIIANAWSLQSLPGGLRKMTEELIASAEVRNTKNASDAEAYKPDAFSRTLGGHLRRDVKARAKITQT